MCAEGREREERGVRGRVGAQAEEGGKEERKQQIRTLF